MQFIKTPMKGMADQLPKNANLREVVLRKFKDVYFSFGFNLIETPVVEHIENLQSNQGGDNEKLIFKILKRGEKLDLASADLCDSGLRYDLTVPLCRFFANNANSLSLPFKSLQIGNVFRADRPQKGRFRQFTQVDIDILGEQSSNAEVELINATTTALCTLPLGKIKVKINDRRLLKLMALCAGFCEDNISNVYIELDKLDKIGLEGVKSSLLGLGFESGVIDKYLGYFACCDSSINVVDFLKNNNIEDVENISSNLQEIIDLCNCVKNQNVEIVFDPTLVRGMGYYTGTIFEIELGSLNMSVAGGGRYDEMIEKYAKTKVCACGFSIGFERIITVLEDLGYQSEKKSDKVAMLISKDLSASKKQQAFIYANKLRDSGVAVSVVGKMKNTKFQKDALVLDGYTKFVDVFEDTIF